MILPVYFFMLLLICWCSHIVKGQSLISGLEGYLPQNNHGKREGEGKEKKKKESPTFCPNSDLRFPTSWYLISHRVTNDWSHGRISGKKNESSIETRLESGKMGHVSSRTQEISDSGQQMASSHPFPDSHACCESKSGNWNQNSREAVTVC